MAHTFTSQLRNAGVVGAGGAGFPTYVKASSNAETAIVNAAECEPLLHKDLELLYRHTDKMLDGLELLMSSVGAAKGIIGIKRKHGAALKTVEAAAAKRRGVSVCPLDDFYPAGDEYCLVYETTRRVIPPGGLPLDAGAVVCNVETLFNAAQAEQKPVTEKYLTVTGEVNTPVTLKLPVGTLFSEAIRLAGT
ncbi:MAG TPA: SLBB domain-containing protein, partial [Elusimicrobiales bacterium]|nr:SLBB domain-containing protein [Elusimicrobiales bacterium]